MLKVLVDPLGMNSLLLLLLIMQHILGKHIYVHKKYWRNLKKDPHVKLQVKKYKQACESPNAL